MAEKTEKSKRNSVKYIPKDAQVIMSIMKEMDITEYEPRVINTLLEFTYKYVASTLEDAKTYANHAKRKSIDLEDVKLALQIQQEQTFTSPPPRSLVAEIAHSKNILQMPLIKPHFGIRLPPDRFCLSTSNVRRKLPEYIKKPVKVGGQYSGNFGERNLKMNPKVNVGTMKRTKTQTVTIPKPGLKFSYMVPKPKIPIAKSLTTPESTTDEPQSKRAKDNEECD